MNIYVINLDRSPERMQWVSARLQQLGLTFTRVRAVDGMQLAAAKREQWEQVRHPEFGMGPGEIACFLSHREALKQFVGSGDDWCLIVEDDVHVSDNLATFIRDRSWIPADADVIKGETVRQRAWFSAESTGSVAGHKLRQLKSNHGGAAGYFVRRKTAIWLLQESEQLCTIPDQLLFNPKVGLASQMKIYQIDPAIVVQDWLINAPGKSANWASLLLQERERFHSRDGHRSRLSVPYWAGKATRPLKKAGVRLVHAVVNAIGNQQVKKVDFCAAAAAPQNQQQQQAA